MELPDLAGNGVKDLYDSERLAILNVRDTMFKRHAFRGVGTARDEDEIKRRFTEEMRDRCADLGFVVEVEWDWESEEKDDDGIPLHQSPCVSGVPEDNNLYWLPRTIFIGRTERPGEFDHDRMKSEVRGGLLDGKAGVINPDTGLLSEDPKKKNIY